MGQWVRADVERFDWKTRAALRKKSRKNWDAVRQLMRYSEVVGEGEAISVQARDQDDCFPGRSPPTSKSQ